MVHLIGTIAMVAVLLVAGFVPIYVVVQSITRLKRFAGHRVVIALKAIGSLTLWILVSFVMFQFVFFIFLGARDPDPHANAITVMFRLVALSLVYLLIGLGVVVWVRREIDDKPARLFP